MYHGTGQVVQEAHWSSSMSSGDKVAKGNDHGLLNVAIASTRELAVRL